MWFGAKKNSLQRSWTSCNLYIMSEGSSSRHLSGPIELACNFLNSMGFCRLVVGWILRIPFFLRNTCKTNHSGVPHQLVAKSWLCLRMIMPLSTYRCWQSFAVNLVPSNYFQKSRIAFQGKSGFDGVGVRVDRSAAGHLKDLASSGSLWSLNLRNTRLMGDLAYLRNAHAMHRIDLSHTNV